jgi:hypothetical protein
LATVSDLARALGMRASELVAEAEREERKAAKGRRKPAP